MATPFPAIINMYYRIWILMTWEMFVFFISLSLKCHFSYSLLPLLLYLFNFYRCLSLMTFGCRCAIKQTLTLSLVGYSSPLFNEPASWQWHVSRPRGCFTFATHIGWQLPIAAWLTDLCLGQGLSHQPPPTWSPLIGCRVLNAFGRGPQTTNIFAVVFIITSVPTEPLNFVNTSRNASSATFHWLAPLRPNGLLRSYQVWNILSCFVARRHWKAISF